MAAQEALDFILYAVRTRSATVSPAAAIRNVPECRRKTPALVCRVGGVEGWRGGVGDVAAGQWRIAMTRNPPGDKVLAYIVSTKRAHFSKKSSDSRPQGNLWRTTRVSPTSVTSTVQSAIWLLRRLARLRLATWKLSCRYRSTHHGRYACLFV